MVGLGGTEEITLVDLILKADNLVKVSSKRKGKTVFLSRFKYKYRALYYTG